MAKSKRKSTKRARKTFTKEFKQQAVQMMADGCSASSVADKADLLTAKLHIPELTRITEEGLGEVRHDKPFGSRDRNHNERAGRLVASVTVWQDGGRATSLTIDRFELEKV